MHWIALLPPEDARLAWGWHALQFTPRVALLDEALVLEVSASLRLWGGVRNLMQQLLLQPLLPACGVFSQGATALVALARLRLRECGVALPKAVPDGLPLETLTAALPHVDMLERTGCRTWGQLRALPRGGVARRFGAALLDVLDTAYGDRPERYAWQMLPDVFDRNLELPALATSAPELMWTAQRLLAQLQVWLVARQRGVLAFELEWTHDLRRLDGAVLPRTAQLPIRTAQPTQDIAHLRRLVGEQLDRTPLAAPVNHLRLRSLDIAAWAGASKSLLLEDQVKGERLHQLVERLGARLGPQQVLVPVPQADHRPERMQRWVPAHEALKELKTGAVQAAATKPQDAAPPYGGLHPSWLLTEPMPLDMQDELPLYHGRVELLTKPQRIEAGWWDSATPKAAFREYCMGRSDEAGLLWLYREMSVHGQMHPRWFLQGLYA